MKFLEMSVPLPSAMKALALYVFKPLHPSPDSEQQQIFFHHSHARSHTQSKVPQSESMAKNAPVEKA